MSQTDRNATQLEPQFHAVSHYGSPADVLADDGLSTDEKRIILSSWASDMYAVDSHPALREVPGVPHRLRLDDILTALKRLDDETDPPPRGGMAMRLPGFRNLDCAAPAEPRGAIALPAATRRHRPIDALRTQNQARWSREANVRRYRKLLATPLTAVERNFIERRLAEELYG